MSETLSAPVIDKTTWGPGAWQNEPDRADWIHEGYACMARRHAEHGHWCGYVGVPSDHPRYGIRDADDLEAHGGVNYAAVCQGEVCHVPGAGDACRRLVVRF